MQVFLGSGQPLQVTGPILLNIQEARFDRKKTKDIVAVIKECCSSAEERVHRGSF